MVHVYKRADSDVKFLELIFLKLLAWKIAGFCLVSWWSFRVSSLLTLIDMLLGAEKLSILLHVCLINDPSLYICFCFLLGLH